MIWELLKEERKTTSARLIAYIPAYDNISCILIEHRALANHSQVAMLLGALQTDLRVNMVMKLRLDPRYTLMF